MYALWDSNPGSWLAKEQKSRLRFGGRWLLLLNDEALYLVGGCRNGGYLVARRLVTDGRMRVWTPKYSLYPKEHPANYPLRSRLSNGLGVYLS
jgi:hypothetical protein